MKALASLNEMLTSGFNVGTKMFKGTENIMSTFEIETRRLELGAQGRLEADQSELEETKTLALHRRKLNNAHAAHQNAAPQDPMEQDLQVGPGRSQGAHAEGLCQEGRQ